MSGLLANDSHFLRPPSRHRSWLRPFQGSYFDYSTTACIGRRPAVLAQHVLPKATASRCRRHGASLFVLIHLIHLIHLPVFRPYPLHPFMGPIPTVPTTPTPAPTPIVPTAPARADTNLPHASLIRLPGTEPFPAAVG